MPQYNKKEIIHGIINFDKELYKHLDTMYREKVVWHVIKNSGTREDGEELYNDTIFEIYLNIERGRYSADGTGTFGGYLMTIVRSRWVDRLRKRKLSFEELEVSNEQIPSDNETEATAEALKNQRIIAIRKHLERLSKDEQEYVRLYYFTQKSLPAIAEYFGTSYEYVRLKLYRIREKLKKMIANDPEFGTSLF